MHGGAPGSGAPKGNKNALKHGNYDAAAKALKRRINDIYRQAMAIAESPPDALVISVKEDEI